MKVLITGCGGFLGSYLFKSLKRPDTIGLSRNELDLSNESEVKKK